MNGNERILAALARRRPDRVPTFEWFIDESVGRALTGSAEALEIVERLDLDGINIRPDYGKKFVGERTFVDEWGIRKQLTGDCIPAVMASPIRDITRHREYAFPDPEAPGRLATLARAVERFGGRRAVVFNIRDGFSDLRDLLGYETALVAPLAWPEACAELLDRIADYNIALARRAARELGIRIVATTDDVAMASGPLFSPEQYFEFIGPSFKKAMAGFKEAGCLIVKHCDGDVRPLAEFWVAAGIDALDPIDPGAGLAMAAMKAQFGGRICLKGNVDCVRTLCTGTAEEVREEVRQCLAQGGPEGLILSSSNTIHRGVKPENYRVMLEALREFERY